MQHGRILKTLTGSFGAEVVNKIVPLLILHLVIRRIGVEGFGYAQFGWNLVDSCIPLVVAGYSYLATVELGQSRDDPRAISVILSEVTALKLAHAVLAVAGLLLTLWMRTSYHKYASVTLPLSLVLVTSALDMSYVHVGTGRVLSLSAIITTVKLIGLLLIPALVHAPADATLFALLFFGANGVIGVANFGYNVRRFPLVWPRRAALRARFLAALPFAVTVALTMAVDRYDQFVVEHYLGPAGAGLYGGTVRIIQALSSLVTVVGMVFFAEVVATKDEDSLTRHVNLGLWSILALLLPTVVGAWFVGGPVLAAVLSDDYVGQGPVFTLLALGLVFQGLIANYGMQVLMVKRRALAINGLLALGLACGLGLATVLGARFGVMGVACGSMTGRAIAGLGMALAARKFLTRLPWRELATTAAPALGMGLALAAARPEGLVGGIALGVATWAPLFAAANFGKVRATYWLIRSRAKS